MMLVWASITAGLSMFGFIGACRGIYEVIHGPPDGNPIAEVGGATILCILWAGTFAYLSGLAWRAA